MRENNFQNREIKILKEMAVKFSYKEKEMISLIRKQILHKR